jgi:hypothetical protein
MHTYTVLRAERSEEPPYTVRGGGGDGQYAAYHRIVAGQVGIIMIL